ncbi:cell filamentation protein Fic [Endozoicomonas numazuensis]|uniref:Cell filamentation protein Fic n=1 Tax=Endozoicomonas numazuensis TaxID=1137799 RepID=A0A081NLV7_9GAMM|nr:cell filamentation protein Fic [Endozoicomonas numazuensis]
MYKKPPLIDYDKTAIEQLKEVNPSGGAILDYLDFMGATDSKGRYLPFNDFRFRVSKGIDTDLAWRFTKEARNKTSLCMFKVGEGEFCFYNYTPAIYRAMSMVDRHTTTSHIKYLIRELGESEGIGYLLEDLIEDEAISSSQLEGAATTTKVAKAMLATERKPRTADEKMILGNFRMMNFAWENRLKSLTPDLIKEMHKIGVEGIDDEEYTPGTFRHTDDIFVVGAEGEVVHKPPSAEKLEERLSDLCRWVNADHESEEIHIHPLLKAIAIHFAIGYEHPFRDGNGRVARSLFYWFMFKNSFEGFRYISISVLLKAAAVQYGMSYVHTESDEMDLTYFIEYQVKVVVRAINNFMDRYKAAMTEEKDFMVWLVRSGSYAKMTTRQRMVYFSSSHKQAGLLTAKSTSKLLNISQNTALKELNGLCHMGLLDKFKEGNKWIFRVKSRKDILDGPAD